MRHSNSLVNTGMIEIQTDGIDNDCNGEIDEYFSTLVLESGLVLNSGQPMTISIDDYDDIHIAYHDSSGLNYISQTNGTWNLPSSVPLTSGYVSGSHVRGVVDSADRFQIAFTTSSAAGTQLDFMHMDISTQTWSNQLVLDQITSSALDSEFQLDIDVDAANLPTIGYFSQEDKKPYLFETISFATTPISSLTGVFSSLDEYCLAGFCLGYTGSYLSLELIHPIQIMPYF